MEIYMMTQPSLPLTRACAPSALLPISAAPVAAPVSEWAPALLMAPVAPAAEVRSAERAPISGKAVRPVAVLAAERAPASRVHQVQVQAELVRVLTLSDEINGTTGFKGSNSSKKRYADGGSGVPPRGRPVW
ncbi:hypothetical protein [Paractinoplanes durhamensis]|nr:hypothetical protein [Actinoplanes durhamensis]